MALFKEVKRYDPLKIAENNFLYVTKVMQGEKVFYDVRKYYVNKKEELMPTRKGLMLDETTWKFTLDYIKESIEKDD